MRFGVGDVEGEGDCGAAFRAGFAFEGRGRAAAFPFGAITFGALAADGAFEEATGCSLEATDATGVGAGETDDAAVIVFSPVPARCDLETAIAPAIAIATAIAPLTIPIFVRERWRGADTVAATLGTSRASAVTLASGAISIA